jgi:hypothetical protein
MLARCSSRMQRGETVELPRVKWARGRGEQHAQAMRRACRRCNVQRRAAFDFICEIQIRCSTSKLALLLLPTKQCIQHLQILRCVSCAGKVQGTVSRSVH